MGKIAGWGAPQFLVLTKRYEGGHIKKDEIGGTCSTHGDDKTFIQNLLQSVKIPVSRYKRRWESYEKNIYIVKK